MSWFFGKKKVKDSPPDSSEDASPSTSHADDYILIERQINPAYPSAGGYRDDASMKSFGIYPLIPDPPVKVPTIPSNIAQMDVLCDMPSYLNCVKFQLSKKFENDTELERLRIDEILAFILRVKNEDYHYDFSVENSVINEMATTSE